MLDEAEVAGREAEVVRAAAEPGLLERGRSRRSRKDRWQAPGWG